MTQFGYPIALDLHGVPVLVVGAGPVAARKVAGLAAAGARVTVVAIDVSSALDLDLVHLVHTRPFRSSDVDGQRLVITATGDSAVDHAVAAAATAADIWVNAADERDACTFILPAVARRGPLSIAVSTDGSSPALAGRLRDRARELLTADVEALVDRLSATRARLRAAGGSTELIDWAAEIDPVLAPPRRTSSDSGRGGSGPDA